jgi:TPR repeat protein
MVRLHRRAAEYGDPSIQAAIGLHFLMGQYLVQKDEAEGMRLIRAAADAGGPSAIMDIAGQLLDGPHKLLALTYLQDPAKVSDANLQMEIGFRFLDGWGQNYIDEELARKWITAASETGGANTRLMIATRFLNMNTNQSVATKVVADRWFQNTAAGSDAVVQLEVGKMLMRRKRGIPINRDEGLRWLHRAASNGSHEAQRLWCRYTDTEDWPAISAEKPEPSIGTPAGRDFPGTSES